MAKAVRGKLPRTTGSRICGMLIRKTSQSTFALKSAARSLTVALMAALQFLGKYRETGLLLIRASLGLIFIILIAPVLWNGQGSWEHFGSAMRHLDFHSHYKFWGFLGALLGCAGGVLMILGLFFRIGVLFALAVTVIHLITLWDSHGDFHSRIPALEMSILLLSLIFIGPGKYSVDKG
jgi:putative oxidoreductase